MRPEAVLERFELWRRLGWMRPLEARFVAFLAGLEPGGDARVPLAAGLVSHALAQGHVCLDLEALVQDPAWWLALPPEQDSLRTTERFDEDELRLARRSLDDEIRAMDPHSWQSALQQSRLVSGGKGNTPLVLEGSRLYLRRNWSASREVFDELAGRSKPVDPAAEASVLKALFNELFPTGDEAPGHNWQKIACAVALRYRFSIITGGPGTGKTWTMVKLLGLLQAVNQVAGVNRPLRVMLAAPTGKAAARMTESVRNNWAELPERYQIDAWRPEDARTLHRLLGTRPGSRHFQHQRHNPVQADVVIVDEASMIDLQLMQALVRGISPHTRLVLLGDKDQLASVEPGAVFGDLCRGADMVAFGPELIEWLEAVAGERVKSAGEGAGRMLVDQTVMLRQARRFNEDIGALAEAVNAGRPEVALDLLQSRAPVLKRVQPVKPEDDAVRKLFIDHGHARYLHAVNRPAWLLQLDSSAIGQAAGRTDALENWARECLVEFGHFQVLTGTRGGPWGVDDINQRIRQWLGQAGQVDPAGTWFHGRPVMINRNDYRTGLMNGDVGLCLRWPSRDGTMALRVVFQKANGQLHHYATTRIVDCQTAWAMTVHKSQGSEFTHAVLVLPDQPSRVLTRELVYTGLTRARERFTLVVPNEEVFDQAVQQRTRRSSALARV